jgi:hypothetical protein
MTYVDWEIKGPKIGVCSCDYGCPCEFNGRPTQGFCEGAEAHLIEKGHFGDVSLDGLIIGASYRWPGAVHEGGGWAQGFIDKRATEGQVDALFKILGGEEQEPTTVFNIYGSTMEGEHDPIFADMDFDCNIENRTGHFKMDGVVQLAVEPIRNPVTGKPHRARIVLPEGFEFREAEMASGDLVVDGGLKMEHHKSYGGLWYAAYGPMGVIEMHAT